MNAARVTLFTAKVTLPVPLGMPLRFTLHWPLLPVVQEAVPLAPLLQVPMTVALATPLWFTPCTVMVTVAVHWLPWRILIPSRPPTCIGVGVGVAVGVLVLVGVGVLVGVRVTVGNGVFVADDTDVGVTLGVGALPAGPMYVSRRDSKASK